MTRRFLIGLMAFTIGCGSTGSGGTAGNSGGGTSGGTAGQTGTGGSNPGTGGDTTGTGGDATGTGGSATGTGGSATGTGGSATGTGGSTAGTGGSTGGSTGGRGGSTAGSGGRGGSTAGTGGSTAGSGGRGGSTGGSTAGAGGRGGSTGTGGQLANQSVTERNKNPSRDGHFVQPGLTRAAAATMVATPSFTGTFSGTMFASPLYYQNGPGGVGLIIAATTGNDVYAINENTGATVWMKNIGSSPQQSGAGCGSINPIGIESTGVIDAATGTLYVAGAIGTSNIQRHEVHALNLADGTEKSGWPVDVSTAPGSGGMTFMPQPQNQRSALSLVGGTLYVAYGGHVGDCGPYHGWVIGINAANPAMKGGWATGGQGEGIWAAGGMASDGTGVFAATGNRTPSGATGAHQDSEQLVRITGLGTRSDLWYPSRWMTMDGSDIDLGSVNPVYVEQTGSTPSKMVLQLSKDGHLYILDAAALGNTAAPKADITLTGSGMSNHGVPTVYKTSMGMYFVFGTTGGANMCPGGVTGRAVVAARITAGSPPTATVAWCAAISGSASTQPIATTTDGMSESIVWIVNNGNLKGYNGDTGAQVYSSTNTCSNVQRWTSPIAFNNKIVVGGNGHLCSWSLP
jgi:hypothetical protein